MIKRTALIFCLIILSGMQLGFAQQPKLQGRLKELFAGPANPSDNAIWLQEMKAWRIKEKQKLDYVGSQYLQPQLSWLKHTFIYVQMMAHDRYFYNPVTGKYTVERYLDDLKRQFGGIDAVLIWPTYPNIGIDNRNQFDLLSDMPGGLKGVRKMVMDFKKRGVRVFFPIMIWDRGTRKISISMPDALLTEMKMVGSDGMNGDTMHGVTKDFFKAYQKLDYPMVLQPEVRIRNLKMVEWNTSSWGYYWGKGYGDFTYVPGVSVYKWLEPRHQVFETNRWAVDKTNDLQYAFFNGIGYNAWENIWGSWNQIAPRYEQEIRRIAKIYRKFPGIWNSEKWQPFVTTLKSGIFASEFPGLDKTVYTLINRGSSGYDGPELRFPRVAGMDYFDLWNGRKLTPENHGKYVEVSFPIEGRGFGAVLAIKHYAVKNSFYGFLAGMHRLAARTLESYSSVWIPLQQHIVRIERTHPASQPPKGMVLIPGIKNYEFASRGVMIEGDPLPKAVGIQYPWETHPARSTRHEMSISSFYIDKYPVTNREYKKFLDATHYHPKDDHNFLKDWKNGTYPKGWGNKPVTWVSLGDARAYASWAGKRLPHEWEWQYAAQGSDGRIYPWGNKWDPGKVPPADTSRTMRAPTNVNAYPKGASPFGVMDMVGNVWQWTDEYVDKHTRAAVLKGSGYYRASGSKWYFPRAYKVDEYEKYLLMAPSIDRSATIGFRCVKDR